MTFNFRALASDMRPKRVFASDVRPALPPCFHYVSDARTHRTQINGNSRGLPNTAEMVRRRPNLSAPKAAFTGPTITLTQVPDGVPVEWIQGFAKMLSMQAPQGFAERDWRTAVGNCTRFVESDRLAQIAALGWTELECFGCHSRAPHANLSAKGLAFFFKQGERAIAATKDTVTFKTQSGAETRFYRRNVAKGGVAVWELNQSTTNEREKP